MGMMLAACAPSAEEIGAGLAVPSPLPPLSAEDAAPCPDPGVRAGQPALTELARNRVALAVCRDRHGRVVALYEDVAVGRKGAP